MKMGFLNYLTGWRKLGIKRGDLVLEVGSGGNPLIRSDVLCDKYILDDFERALGNVSIPIIMDRPFVCGDAEFLPFRDNSFDFLVSFHMMEHLENPDLFLEEAQRVAPQGYIVTPNSNCESLFGSYKHRWLIDVSEDNEILLKNKSDVGGILNGFFHQLYKTNADFRTFWHHNSHLFEARFRWQRPIIYSLENDLAAQPAQQGWFTKATLKSESTASE